MADTTAAMELSEAEKILMNIMKQTDESYIEEVEDESDLFLNVFPQESDDSKTLSCLSLTLLA